ncbi:MAG: thioredoxin family protein [Sarcina sp.]
MKVYSKEEVQEFIKENIMCIVYFSGGTCSACPAIKAKVKEVISKYEKIKFIDIDVASNLEVSASYDVFSMPLLLLFVDGKESMRLGRNIDFMDFEKNINRYYEMLF